MITEDLVIYIQAQLRKNTPHDLIISKLAQAGWHKEDIDEGMKRVLPPVVVAPTIPVQTVSAPTTPVVVPVTILPVSVAKKEVEQKPASVSVASNAFAVSRSVITEPKVWTPTQPKEVVAPVATPSVIPAVEAIATPVFFSTEDVVEEPDAVDDTKEVENVSELIPTLTQKPVVGVIPPVAPAPVPAFVPVANPYALGTSARSSLALDSVYKTQPAVEVPQNALLSSYAQAYAQATGELATQAPIKRSFTKWIVGLVALLLLAGGVFSYEKGWITIPNFALVKKDPKDILNEMPASFAQLSSYGTHTKIKVSSPSFANIASGLVSGQVSASQDKEYISFDTQGFVGGHASDSPFSYTSTIKSSLVKMPLLTSFVFDGTSSYLDIPSLVELAGANAPTPQTVSFVKGESNLLLNELPTDIMKFFAHVDLDALVANRIAPFINDKTVGSFTDFIDKATIVDKGAETLATEPVYHYTVTSDRAETKKLLVSLATVYTKDMTTEVSSKLSDILGTATFDSFDIWVGQKDMMIHKYSFTLSLPLSRVLGLEDKGIAGNEVTIDWETVYSGFNSTRETIVPEASTPLGDFLRQLHDMKIKNTASLIAPIARNLKNADGSYGKRVNQNGSCANPNPSSLFSPLGHAKGATVAVGAMASTMNTLLYQTNGAGSCFSNLGAWAASFPLATDPTASICVDSVGNTRLTTIPLAGVICK